MKSVNVTPRFWVAFGLVLFVLIVGLIGPLIVRTSPDAVIGGLYDPPHGFGAFMLGTDNEGQSVIANLVYGTRTSLIVGLLAGLVASSIGLIIGIVAGYRGGVVDDILSGFTNVALAIPGIVVVIL
ncbi:MAG: ABC transporter permease, partial [Propionibacteriaceae bacterium]